ncbi:MAG TPA: hypothetical protein VE258_03740 [Ktedonobacterales bacterium]|nr:hypothetical protein [Ktedonobacterales bacterium]
MSRQSATTMRTSVLRDRIALGLMLLSALGALYAFATAIGATSAAGPATQQVEAWRALGYLMFAAIFVLLGLWPRRYPYLWEVVIVNKAALTIVEVVLIGKGAADAQSTALADGILTVLLVAAYLLSRGYASWWGRAART